MKKIVIITSILICGGWQMIAQNNSTRYVAQQQHAWATAVASIDLSPKWFLHAEFQERRADFGENVQQHLARVGLLHRLDDKHHMGGGYAFIYTGSYGELPAKHPFDEHRIWLQYQAKDQFKSLSFTHRYRFEFRHIDPTHTSRNEYRVRYNLRLQHTLIRRPKHQLYAAVFDEVFLNMGKKVAYNLFDQNRLAGVVGFTVNDHLSIEAGYLNQYLLQRSLNEAHQNKVENNHTALFSLVYTGALHKQKEKDQ